MRNTLTDEQSHIQSFIKAVCCGGTTPVIDNNFPRLAQQYGMYATEERRAIVRNIYAQAIGIQS